MPIYLIERNYAEQLEVNPEGAAEINVINAEEDVKWLVSFLSADKMKSYCLYEAASPEAIREAAQRAGLPADVILPVGEVLPTGETGDVEPARFA